MTAQTTRSQPGGPQVSMHACGLCEGEFRSKRGLGQHERIMHPVQSNERINVKRKQPKWLPEEVRLLAQMEAEATIDGLTRGDLKRRLYSLKTDRPTGGIDGQRKKAEYKTLVISLIANLGSYPEAVEDTPTRSSGGNEHLSQRERILESIELGVAEMRTMRNKYARALQELGEAALRGERLEETCLVNAIKSWFQDTKSPKGPNHANVVAYHGTRKQRRQQEYARVQKLYKEDVKAAARVILDNTDQVSVKLPRVEEVFGVWGEVFQDGEGMPEDLPDGYAEVEGMTALWDPVTIDELKRSRVDQNSAAGPDGITPRSWNRINYKFKKLIYNLFLLYGKVPKAFKVSRTVFIPKVEGGSLDPNDLRPLTVCSVVLRGFNKILAQRLVTLYQYDDRQTAYLPMDGVGVSNFVLQGVMSEARRQRKELHMAFIDQHKAFNRLKHRSIVDSLMGIGCPRGFVKYVKDMYTDVKTMMQFEGHWRMTQVNRGVYQGDPLSGPAFTVALERMLKALDGNVGFDIGDVRINAGAYADDGDLVGSTRPGLQRNIDRFTGAGALIGLDANPKKTYTFSQVPDGKGKKLKIVTEMPFNINGVELKQLTITSLWRYLGVDYDGRGPVIVNRTMEKDLESLTKAPLKPQQRIHLLKAVVIPRHQDRLVLSRTTAKALKRTDRQIAQYVRRWLKLPHDVPMAYLYAPVKAGGLGVPCLQLWIHVMRLNRLEKAIQSGGKAIMALSECNLFKTIIHRCNQSLAVLGDEKTQSAYHSYWRERLVSMVDGKDLEHAGTHKSSTSWNGVRAEQISGEDYVHYHQIRANCLPTRVRTARGRPAKDKGCRGKCGKTETAQHVIQECHRTHSVRVGRHDRVVGILGDQLKKNYKVILKQEFGTVRGKRKPDLILVKGDTAHVLDVQIVRCSDLDTSHVVKVGKYQVPELEAAVKNRYSVDKVVYHACTLSFKGVWCQQSVMDMKRLGVSEYSLFKVVTSTLRGTWLGWRQFNRVTFVTR